MRTVSCAAYAPFVGVRPAPLMRRVSSGRPLPPSPPAEKATTARQDQARQSSTGDGAGDAGSVLTGKRVERRESGSLGSLLTLRT